MIVLAMLDGFSARTARHPLLLMSWKVISSRFLRSWTARFADRSSKLSLWVHLAVGIEQNEKPILATALKRRGLSTSDDELQGAPS
jgi:hypothetical protein